ncbi:hypothetical protein Pcinc_030732 [Petrolisthes cinctipes]|uniref:Uncharacterized protein n=1 Tax=Petrolisthes cinctipes TaxID=88211 RepID=A0AAE1EY56_PETCI|nr:hypothetical protein Pcinc_030732 [Petrolisthes cinctipes]
MPHRRYRDREYLMHLYHSLKIPQNQTMKERAQYSMILRHNYPTLIPVTFTRFPAGVEEEVKQQEHMVFEDTPLASVLSMNDPQDFEDIEEERAFYFIAGRMPNIMHTIGTLHNRYAEVDGRLYIVMCCGRSFVPQPRFLHDYVEPEYEEMNGPER